MAAITADFTIAPVTEMPGEDEDWLWELSLDLEPEGECLPVSGAGATVATAFSDDGIKTLKTINDDRRAIGRSPPPLKRVP